MLHCFYMYNEKEREKHRYLALFASSSFDSMYYFSLFYPYDCLTVYLPLKLENFWYPILYESTNRNELASVVGRWKLFPIRSFFTYPSVCFPVLCSLLFSALVFTSHVFYHTLFFNSLSYSDLSAKWWKSTFFHFKSRNSSNRSMAFRTIIDFRNDFGVLQVSS